MLNTTNENDKLNILYKIKFFRYTFLCIDFDGIAFLMKRIVQISRSIILVAGLFFYSASQAGSPPVSYPVPSDKDVVLKFGNASLESFSGRLNILVWNLHKGENKNFSADFISLAYDKDIVLSQEMYLNPFMLSVFESFPHYLYSSATSFFYGKDLVRTGVVTSSPVEPVSLEFVRTKALEPIVNSPKITLISKYPIRFSNKYLTVVNIHGINFVDNDSYRNEMNRIVDIVKKISGPIVFAGDFNSWNDERDLILKEMRLKLRLSEARFNPDFRLRFNKHPLDHFFFSDDIKVISAKAEEYYDGSDHKPLELVIEYAPKLKVKDSWARSR